MDNPYYSSLQHVIDYMRERFYLGGSRRKLRNYDTNLSEEWRFQLVPFEKLPNVDKEWILECFDKQEGFWVHKNFPQIKITEDYHSSLFLNNG